METTGSSAVSWDLYREIHKGLRLALFTITTKAGSTDPVTTLTRISPDLLTETPHL
jgi:hypothetical protein